MKTTALVFLMLGCGTPDESLPVVAAPFDVGVAAPGVDYTQRRVTLAFGAANNGLCPDWQDVGFTFIEPYGPAEWLNSGCVLSAGSGRMFVDCRPRTNVSMECLYATSTGTCVETIIGETCSYAVTVTYPR